MRKYKITYKDGDMMIVSENIFIDKGKEIDSIELLTEDSKTSNINQTAKALP